MSAIAFLKPIADGRALETASAGPWRDSPAIASWLKENSRAFQLFQRAARRPMCVLDLRANPSPTGDPRWSHALLFVSVPGLGAFDVAVRGVLADEWHQWAIGDQAVVVDGAMTSLSVAHHLESQRPMVAIRVGVDVAERGYEAIRRAMFLAKDRSILASRLVEQLTQWDPPHHSLVDAYEFQKLMILDTLQRVYRPGMLEVVASAESIYNYAAGQRDRGGIPWEKVRRDVAGAGFDRSVLEVERYFEGLNVWNEQPFVAALSRTDEIVKMGEAVSNPLTRILVANLTLPRRWMARVETLRRGTHLLARIMAYQAKEGRYPPSLRVLGGSPFIRSIRVDPYSGDEFVYAQTREGFVLYSVGVDRKDDAGRPYRSGSEVGDLVIWPVH